MMNRMYIVAAGVAAVLLADSLGWADDWSQFRGPTRDGKSAETGLLKAWPAEGPKLLWTAKGCGNGYGSPVVVGDRIYVTGDVGDKAAILAFDLQGQPKGRLPFSEPHTDKDFPGVRGSVTVDDGLLYALSPSGDLVCADRNLQKKWLVNVLRDYRGSNPNWKLSESVLIDGDNVICTPGGPDATIVALNKKSGAKVWTSKGLGDQPGYASAIKVTVDKVPQIVTLTASGLVGVSARTGQFLWRYDRPSNKTANCPSPVALGNRVFCATGYGNGGGAVDLAVSGAAVTATPAWETKDMVCHHGGYVIVDGYLYGNNGNGWACLDFKTGETKWKAAGVGKGSIIYADGMLYCMSEKGGRIGLVKASPESYQQVAEFSIPKGGEGSSWAHPAIADGRLYVRHRDFLFAFDIKDPAAPAPGPKKAATGVKKPATGGDKAPARPAPAAQDPAGKSVTE